MSLILRMLINLKRNCDKTFSWWIKCNKNIIYTYTHNLFTANLYILCIQYITYVSTYQNAVQNWVDEIRLTPCWPGVTTPCQRFLLIVWISTIQYRTKPTDLSNETDTNKTKQPINTRLLYRLFVRRPRDQRTPTFHNLKIKKQIHVYLASKSSWSLSGALEVR